ncbi:DUF3443 domain-containing protein [Paraburkholderia sp. PREW-6R]|uniref:DUF3443 domain-containing protein n=1 Tax=Paraburkholderia sp. PREW-6R TaxID=3141544 RepID=UPI0031F48237
MKPPFPRLGSLLALSALCATLVACGGGGSSASSASAGSGPAPAANPGGATTPAGATPPASLGTSSTDTSVPQSTTPNVQPIAVATAPGLTRNMLTTSVTVCQPGTSHCATIDNVQVDTGSQGLRILASAMPSTLALPALSGGGNGGSGASAECAVFGGGYTWGAVRSADVRMAGQQASAIPIQVIADPAVPTVPSDCAGSGRAMQTLATLRANGVLGVGLFTSDCGSGCASTALPRWYYSCAADGTCAASAQPVAQQVTNPVSQFPLDNNGVVIDLPAIADAGAASVSGSMIFGIGTQANNVLGNATVLNTNSQTGFVTTTRNGQTYNQSYLDSGSNGYFFSDTQLPQCGYWYCPSSTQSASAVIAGTNGTLSAVTFAIGNSSLLFASGNNAFNNLAGISSNAFCWGLPFFFGRRVYTAIASRTTPAGPGPYFAF